MYYAEAIIDGILCHKSTPKGEWKPMTIQQLTKRIIELNEHIKELKELNSKTEPLP